MNFFQKALEISNKMVGNEKFRNTVIKQGWSEKDANMLTNAVFKTLLPWIAEILTEQCIRPRITPEEDARYIYLYVAVFNCMKQLIQLYVTNTVKTWQEIRQTLQAVGVTALVLTLKAIPHDEARNECFRISISTLEKKCVGVCPKRLLIEIEEKMFQLSDYTPCMAEYKEMTYVIHNAKLRVE